MKKRFIQIGLIFSFVIFLLSSCEDVINSDDTPQLPPQESMDMDFESFPSKDNNTKSATADTVSFQNYNYAAFNVGIWSLGAYAVTIIPRAAFLESFKHDAVSTGENTWEWSYVVAAKDANYSARLTAEVLTDSIQWNMYIAKDGTLGFDEVKWFNGRSSINGSGGYWVLNQNAANPSPYIRADWSKESNEVFTLRYTFVTDEANKYGNYIEYRAFARSSADFDANFNIVDVNNNNSILIKWDRDSRDGQVKKAGEDEWSCWDENLYDTACQ